jgi:hypothetical protein
VIPVQPIRSTPLVTSDEMRRYARLVVVASSVPSLHKQLQRRVRITVNGHACCTEHNNRIRRIHFHESQSLAMRIQE